ncbi:MAG: hypothetical protein L3J51_13000 [Cocleimonas sp.]|nr:hypothetical protein [Cocleimonas sp.]
MNLLKLFCKEMGVKRTYCLFYAIKLFIENFFKIIGYFLLLSLLVGLTLTSCPDNIYLQFMPLVTGYLFFLYIMIIFLGIPAFNLTENMRATKSRMIFRLFVILTLFLLSYYMLMTSIVFELLVAYVNKLFPQASQCTKGFMGFYLG